MAQRHIQAVDPLETTPLLDESLTGADHLIKVMLLMTTIVAILCKIDTRFMHLTQ